MLEKIIKNIQYPIIFPWWKEKELIENLDINEQIEALLEKIELKKYEQDTYNLWLINYYVIFEWKKIAFLNYRKINSNEAMLSAFWTSNTDIEKFEEQEENELLLTWLYSLDDIKIPLNWLVSLIKFVELLKKKKIKYLSLTSTIYAMQKNFYQKTFDYMKEKW